MHVIGLLGGVASGKSLVAQELTRLGAGLLDADRTGHEVLQSDRVENAARRQWGPTVFGADGRIDRAKLARIVFADPPDGPRQRQYLEQLTHPEIGRLLRREADDLAARGIQAAVLDAPLLLEAGWNRLCDTLIFVDAPRELRLARARRRGWSEEDFDRREDVQESLDLKRERADVIVDNSGSPQHTRVQVEQFWRSLVG
jgi:dephospho-CoA kinase